MKRPLFILLVFLAFKGQAQELTAQELLDKSIAYHDPEGKWANFKGGFTVQMKTPKRPVRTTKIELDFPQQYFKSEVERGGYNHCRMECRAMFSPLRGKLNIYSGTSKRTRLKLRKNK